MGRLTSTGAPDDQLKPAAVRLSKSKRKEIGNNLWSAISQALGDRSELDEQLEAWDDLCEMRVDGSDWPWPDASNIFIPFIPTQLDTMQARLAAMVYVPRLYLVEGCTPLAQASQHEVEAYYNAGLNRHDRRQSHYNMLALGLRDGLACMDVTWRRKIAKRKIRIAEVAQEGDFPKIDWETGEPEINWVEHDVEQVEYDDYEIEEVELRDLILVPQTARSIKTAPIVARRMLFMETELRAMTLGDDPEIDADQLKVVLEYVTQGQSELVSEQQSTSTYSAGGLLNASGQTGTGSTSNVRAYDKQLSVFRCYTNIYDIDGDGWPEEAVAWVHESSGELLGIGPYRYLHGRRSLVSFTPLPRMNRYLGYSLVGRLAPIQVEINGTHNSRNNQIELRLSPPRYRKDGVKIDEKGGKWGPDAEYIVNDPNDIGLITLPQLPPDSLELEALLRQYGQEYSGLNAPMTGGQSSGRRSAKEAAIQNQSAGIRIDFIAAQLRDTEREIFEQIHALTKQYGPKKLTEQGQNDDGRPEKLTIEKSKLAQDYILSVSGLGAPLDQQSRTQERMFIYSLLKDVPYIQSDEVAHYRLIRFLVEATGAQDLTGIIGTEQQAKERQQQKMQQMQQQQQMQQMLAAHGVQPGQTQKPGQQQQQKPQGGMPQ